MKSFKELLQNFDEILRKFNATTYSKLQPPLSDTIIDKHLAALDISDPDLKILYQWKNGINVDEGIGKKDWIFSDGVFAPLEFGTHVCLTYSDEYNNLVPIIINIDGGYILFNSLKGNGYGQMYCHSTSELCFDRQCIAYDSLYSMIKTHIVAYKKGILRSSGRIGRINCGGNQPFAVLCRVKRFNQQYIKQFSDYPE